jgi:transposase
VERHLDVFLVQARDRRLQDEQLAPQAEEQPEGRIAGHLAIHSARATNRTLDELGGHIVLHFLSPYCPDANRIKRVWQDLDANVTRNHRCKTIKALLGKAREYLDRYVWRRVTGAAPVIQMAADQRAA